MKMTFVQFHTQLINKEIPKINDSYYDKVFKKYNKDGLIRHKEFWEIPQWICNIYAKLKCLNIDIDFNIEVVTDIFNKDLLAKLNKTDHILFSVLNDTYKLTQDLINILDNNVNITIGGYVDLNMFKTYSHIKTFKTVNDFIKDFFILNFTINTTTKKVNAPNTEYDLDYELFNKYYNTTKLKTIPRLKLTEGCPNHCIFCDVNKIKLAHLNFVNIKNQLISFEKLDYKLIYIDDKSFGNKWLQEFEFNILEDINFNYNFNNSFKFIVQCNISTITKEFLTKCKLNNIWAIELGVETFNNQILEDINKHQTEKEISDAITLINEFNIKVIPNIIIGLPQETKITYDKTLKFLLKSKIAYVNIFLYSDSLFNETSFNNRTKDVKHTYLHFLKKLYNKLIINK